VYLDTPCQGGQSMSARPVLDIRLSGRLDVAAWERRHSAGEVPNRWPCGTASPPTSRHLLG
jgi:hypothetical protein